MYESLTSASKRNASQTDGASGAKLENVHKVLERRRAETEGRFRLMIIESTAIIPRQSPSSSLDQDDFRHWRRHRPERVRIRNSVSPRSALKFVMS